MKYIALVDGRDGAYGVIFPDLPGCTSGGSSVDEALTNAIEAIRLWIDEAVRDGEEIPSPRSADEIRSLNDFDEEIRKGAVLAYVPVLRDEGRSVKATISMDAGILSAIDEAAKMRGLTRSAFLASAARQLIESGS